MKFSQGKSHFHSGHFKGGVKNQLREVNLRSFPLAFSKHARELKAKGFKIINTYRESRLRSFTFGELPKNISEVKRPIFISFYTRGTGYEKEARRLKDSLWRFSLRNDIQSVESTGDWIRNAGMKPKFVRQMMDKYPENPVVWIDADAVIKTYPVIFDKIIDDFACHFRNKPGHMGGELLSGTLYFSNTPESRRLVDLWIKEQENAPKMWDQQTLRRAWEKWKGNTHKLPVEYCHIFDDKLTKQKITPVVEHFQRSREYKNAV
jgi:hypothetical protein